MKKVYLTQKGYEEMLKKLEYLKKTKRREIAKEIGKAREMGDLSENAEYHAAKEQQGHIEKRIADLENTLSNASIIENEDLKANEISIGVTVVLKDVKSNREITYCLVSSEEADIDKNKISITSPVGDALLDHKVNDSVEIRVPAGIITYKILKISR